MGLRNRAIRSAGNRLGPKYGGGFVRGVLDMAIDGVGPLRSAAAAADDKLADNDGDVDRAIASLLRRQSTLAGIQGFATNLGGLVTMAATVPANVVGVMLVQCHLVATIAHLRGYDLDDPRVRNAILAILLGQAKVKALVKKRKLPTRPMAMATSPAHSAELDDVIGREVVTEAIARAAGKRTVSFVARRIPVLGGGVAASGDAYATWQVGQYAIDELKDRRAVKPA